MNAYDSIFSTYFDYNIFLLKLTASWSYDGKSKRTKRYLLKLYNVLCFLYFLVIYLTSQILYIFHAFDNLNTFLRALREDGNAIGLLYKTANYYINKKDILNLMNILQNEDYQYEECEDFKPKQIVEKDIEFKNKCSRFFLNFLLINRAIMWLFVFYTFVMLSEEEYVIENGEKVYKQRLPVNILFSPFGYGTKTKFFFTFNHVVFSGLFLGMKIVAFDVLFITLMSCVSSHLKLLRGAFKTIRPRCIKRINMVVDDHNILLDPKELQDETKKEMNFNNMQKEFFYLLANGFEIFLISLFGDKIIEASSELSLGLYESDWFSTNLAFRKEMILTMARMDKTVYVSIGKFTPLTLITFLTIGRAAFSFFTFIKQMHG
ncbi:odorant receptor 92a [Asbolus verrucosus]|uniref:Odorant receptor n=1 Tax=Asbolus verrucosus TaxID=1661398 RepID=A0A482VV34_ASBVE|nr:odorant receptor 92a [Asbolus verrucosus]